MDQFMSSCDAYVDRPVPSRLTQVAERILFPNNIWKRSWVFLVENKVSSRAKKKGTLDVDDFGVPPCPARKIISIPHQFYTYVVCLIGGSSNSWMA
jgi:hypothetical protein